MACYRGYFYPQNRQIWTQKTRFFAIFGHFCPKNSPIKPKSGLIPPQKRGQKRAFWPDFCQKPGGYPGFWKKGPRITAIYRGIFRVLHEKGGQNRRFLGGDPKIDSFYVHFIWNLNVKGFCHQTSIKRLHLRHIDIMSCMVCCAMQWIQVANRSSAAKGLELS